MKESQYEFWAGLFEIHCCAYEVLDHIIPNTDDSSTSTITTPPPTRPANWDRLDAIVLQWIYGTISQDLLRTIFKPQSTAQQAWEWLKSMFHDNRNSRAVHLQHQFMNTHLENFPDASTYCQELKIIIDQLGLSDSSASLRSIISHREKLPSFYEARSMLILEESQNQQLTTQSASSSTTTLAALNPPPATPSPHRKFNNWGRGSHRGGSNWGRNGRGRG
ncbi:uncharacterized protein [Rutidosis leptorrhynchoides]|uniref:uncharacterized protein n=1 Tax=Rutidosis leptorrhynchoides TaxID=125765 RepID=UPI003A9A041E